MMRIIGSQRYIAPEVLQDGEAGLTAAADIWAVGCIGYELITGNSLFDNDDEILSYAETGSLNPDKIAPIHELPNIYNVISHCLESNPNQRWNVWTLLANLGHASM